ncbi:hypothetical protein BpHYR1_052044 [Brachionus plicatilis]|uniref:Uncharacterized protein n=1 Tax=Brachionus plicatilis TaxID=10195 RepID=A0A3M7RH99_BRAPC|nr:hypothetical protein BpHYR1_052044 [Brachionus plicatilis]
MQTCENRYLALGQSIYKSLFLHITHPQMSGGIEFQRKSLNLRNNGYRTRDTLEPNSRVTFFIKLKLISPIL